MKQLMLASALNLNMEKVLERVKTLIIDNDDKQYGLQLCDL